MSCFSPNYVVTQLDKFDGSLKTTFLGPAKGGFDPRLNPVHFRDIETHGYYYSLVPCGKCAGCRMDYSRVWANRMLIELYDNNESGVFLTLTYNSDHLPYTDGDENGRRYPTLSKRDTQLFWKRLRKAFPSKKIRYFLAGEYGPKTHRPHYHAIVFGLSLSDFGDLEFLKFNKLGQAYYNSPKLAGIWSNGYIVLSDVSWHTCAYVSRYVLKKRGKSNNYVVVTGVEPEFNLSSRKPGIGLLHAVDFVESGLTSFAYDGRDGSVYDITLNRSFYRSALGSIESICRKEIPVELRDLPLEWVLPSCPSFDRYTDMSQFILEQKIKRVDGSSDKLLSKLLLTEVDFETFLNDGARKLDRSLKLFEERID